MPPSWFSAKSGFTFKDADGDLIIVLGPGNHVEVEPLGLLRLLDPVRDEELFTINPSGPGLMAAVRHKDLWRLFDLQPKLTDEKFWQGCVPVKF